MPPKTKKLVKTKTTIPDLDKLKWFVDPIPEWIFEDAAKMKQVITLTAEFKAKEIDLQVKVLENEKMRVAAMKELFLK